MVERLEGLLHSNGLPMTIQRRVISECLEGRTDHPTADQIFEGVQERIPGISRTTVYRVLETFVRIGAVRKVDHPGSSTRFDSRVDRHYHLICSDCQKVVDFEPSRIQSLSIPDAGTTGFEISDYSIHFTGICSDCRNQGKNRV